MLPLIRFTEAEVQADTPFRGHTDQIVQAMYDCGCVILENFLPRSLVEQLASAFALRLAGKHRDTLCREGIPVGPDRYMYPQPLTAPFDTPRIFASGLLLPALRQILGKPQTGATAQHLGSHRKTRPTSTFGFDEAHLAYLRMGDAYLMDYRVVHAGTPNQGPVPRPVIYLGYCRHWYLDAENYLDQGQNYLQVPQALWSRLSPELAHLLSRGRLQVVPRSG